jgi:hypothetical protein
MHLLLKYHWRWMIQLQILFTINKYHESEEKIVLEAVFIKKIYAQ